MKLLIGSTKDIASVNMMRLLKENYGFKEKGKLWSDGKTDLYIVDKLMSRLTPGDFDIDLGKYEYGVFISWHKSESAMPALTFHATGNFSKAEAGGNDHEVSLTSASLLGGICRNIDSEYEGEKFQVVYECTHHGPTDLPIPTCFAEVGSSEKEWNDIGVCNIVLEAALKSEPKAGVENCIGFGGPHYADRFTKRVKEGKFNLSHIGANYALPFVDEDIVKQMIEKTREKVDYVVLQKKMKSEYKQKINGILDDLGVESVRV